MSYLVSSINGVIHSAGLSLHPSNRLSSAENSQEILSGTYSPLKILPGRKMPPVPEQNITLLESWIQGCLKNHPKCQAEDVPLLPKRVIDIGTSPADEITLHETNSHRAFYTALSHQWGKSQLLTTTSTTLSSRKSQIPWHSLSLTFQDAITLTRLLGVRYLWIDSLCIIQDDPVDWPASRPKWQTSTQTPTSPSLPTHPPESCSVQAPPVNINLNISRLLKPAGRKFHWCFAIPIVTSSSLHLR